MPSNLINKTKTIRNLGAIDISELKTIVEGLPEKLWDIETKNRENDYSCFHSTEHVIFKFHRSLTDHSQYIEKPLWKLWKDKLTPIIEQAVSSYGYKNGVVPKVMLAKLLPNRQIDTHIDSAPRNFKCHKIHIPIQTHPDIEFFIDDIGYHLKEGFAYEVNNVVKHGVINKSPINRIHLIFEYFENCE